MDKADLKAANQVLERAVGNGQFVSQQDQFSDSGSSSFISFSRATNWASLESPPYVPDSRKRDAWLEKFVKREPHLLGVLNTACSLVSNRGWRLVGGRNLVRAVRRIMHDANRPEGARYGKGWRHFIRNAARSFYNADISTIIEAGRDGQSVNGLVHPLRAMWSTDPTKFRLTGDLEEPLEYFSPSAGQQRWTDGDFLRMAANPSLDEKYNDLGYCAVSVCLELAKILIAVYQYDQEQLGARAPQGLLLLRNISQRQWNEAMEQRSETLTGKEREFFGGVAVLASLGPNDLDAKLIALSQLPRNFDRQNFITLLMYLYSLTFGFSPDEFWPVQIGWLLGRNTEAELGLERATQKGDADFFLSFQDVFQRELPSSGTGDPGVLFKFEERNDRGRLMAADVALTWSKTVSMLYETGLKFGIPLLDRDQALRMLVDQGIVPAEYTDIEEDTQAFDTHAIREKQRSREAPGVRAYARTFPQDDIMMYRWPYDDWTVLWEAGEVLKPVNYQVVKPKTPTLIVPQGTDDTTDIPTFMKYEDPPSAKLPTLLTGNQ